MKRTASFLVVAFIISLGLSACNQTKTAVTTDKAKVSNPASASLKALSSGADKAADEGTGSGESVEGVLGSYVGQFGDNKITMLVTKAGGGTVSGRTIVAGNDRPFNGTMVLEKGSYVVEAREPGDHKDDGTFKFSIAEGNLNEVKGTWQANDTKRPEKSYTLARKKFEYKTDVGYFPQGSQRLLKTEDVENLAREELSMMRNEIFARHGYCFSRKEYRQLFENEDWYVPNTVDVRNLLTDIEKKNVALIKRYEKYAEEYGDEYGR